jgi:exopolysaccharide production protein ExoY
MSVRTFAADSGRSALVRTLDFVCLVAAYGIATAIASRLARGGMFSWPGSESSDILDWPAQYIVLLLIAVIAWNAVGGYLGIFPSDDTSSPTGSVNQFGRAAVLWVAVIALAIFLFKLPNVSRLFVLSFVSLGIVLIALREYFVQVLRRLNQEDQSRVAIVIGNGAQADWLVEYLRKHFSPEPYSVVKRPDADERSESHTNGTQLGNGLNGTQPGNGLSGTRPRISFEVFVAAADMTEDACSLIPQLLKRGIKTHIIPAVFDASIFRLAVSDIGGVPLVTVRGGEIDALEAVIKRTIDFTGALVTLALAAPVMMVLAVWIKISSSGPVLFRQERLGKNGRRIYIYKFRTMRSDAESILQKDKELYHKYVKNNYKLPKGKDPRITPLGRILRQTSLDELPQLINVLKGEMSLVGPRPVVPSEIEQYGDCASLLLSVHPGLTGQWQVSGRSDIADYTHRVKLDMEYLRDQSVATDLRILLRTLPAVLLRQGAH